YLCAVRQADHRVLYSFTRRSSDLHAEILHFEIILDAVFRALAAVAAFLHAAERRHFGRADALVGADEAVFQRLRHAPHAPDVPAVVIGGETELGVVGELDRIVFRLEAEQRRDRPKGLLAENLHIRLGVGENGRLEERLPERMTLATRDDARALGHRIADVFLDLLDRLHVDQ